MPSSHSLSFFLVLSPSLLSSSPCNHRPQPPVAAQHGATPESPLHNNKTSSNSHHVGTSKVDAEGHNIRKGDGTQAGAVPGLVRDKAEEAKEEEGPQGAYNEETGEINWDCPVSGVGSWLLRCGCPAALVCRYLERRGFADVLRSFPPPPSA